MMLLLGPLLVSLQRLTSASQPHSVPIAPGLSQPFVNLGGVHGSHASNYTAFLALGGRGIDTALTYGTRARRIHTAPRPF
jgi:hypothetical protein